MMETSTHGRQLIEKYEGLILSAYDDANDQVVPHGGEVRGTLTIGYGHTNSAGPPKVYIGQHISKDNADQILLSDLRSVELDVEHLCKVVLNQNQFDALVSFQFNTGALRRSTLLSKLNNGDYKGAANEFFKWNKAGGKTLEGLIKRRREEAALFLTPVTPTIKTKTSFIAWLLSLFFKKGS